MREVRANVYWRSSHVLEVEDDHPTVESIEEFSPLDPSCAEIDEWVIWDDGERSPRHRWELPE